MPAPTVARPWSFPAPVRGWIDSENPAANPGGGAAVIENWYPLRATVRLRGGALRVAVVPSAVRSLIPYRAGTTTRLFAATETAVHDITALNPAATPTAVFSGQTSGRWSHVQFSTPGGSFIVMANGANPMRYYDGATWAAITASSTPIAITGVDTATISHLWHHGSRVWGVQRGTLNAWYLATDSIGGAATQFSLGGVFKLGGALLFGAAWSSDSGDGMDDRCAFISTEGEVAVYQGTDPSDAETWSLVGRFTMGRPIGTQPMQVAGDVIIATTDGLVPLSQVTTRDPAQLSLASISVNIEAAWLRASRTRDVAQPWPMATWHREGMGIVGVPHRRQAYVVNLQTGAWALWTGLDVQCLGLHNDLVYFGDGAGRVFLMEGAGADDGQPYVARLAFQDSDLGAPGGYKEVKQARATFRALAPFAPRLSAASDYRRGFVSPPSAAADDGDAALWDVALWDVARWDDGADSEARLTVTTLWRGIGVSGHAISPQVQVAVGSTRRPDAELVSFDLQFTVGERVV